MSFSGNTKWGASCGGRREGHKSSKGDQDGVEVWGECGWGIIGKTASKQTLMIIKRDRLKKQNLVVEEEKRPTQKREKKISQDYRAKTEGTRPKET